MVVVAAKKDYTLLEQILEAQNGDDDAEERIHEGKYNGKNTVIQIDGALFLTSDC